MDVIKGHHYQDRNGNPVTVSEVSEEKVSFFPKGGGFGYQVSRSLFLSEFEPYTSSGYSAAFFEIDTEGRKWFGYGDPTDLWNGWHKPVFPLETIIKMAEDEGNGVKYDETNDTVTVDYDPTNEIGYSDDERFTTYEAQTIVVDGKKIKVWTIGEGWVWDRVEIVEAPTFEEAVESIKDAIFCMVFEDRWRNSKGEPIPLKLDSFAKLHDYCDANMLGVFADEEKFDAMVRKYGGRTDDDTFPEGFVRFVDEVQAAVDAWLKPEPLIKSAVYRATNAALNAGCKLVQDMMGVETGDAAGIFWAGEMEEKVADLFEQYIEYEIMISRPDDEAD